jgi:hypothetical protein
MPSMDGRWKVCPLPLQCRLLDGRWQGCPLFSNAISGWKGEGMSPALQYHLWMIGGRCVPPALQYPLWMEGGRCVNNSAIPFLDRKVKMCPLLSSYYAIPCLRRSWKGCPLLCNTVSGLKVEGVSSYAAVPYLHGNGSWKGCPLLCNTVYRWNVEAMSPTLQYRLWMDGGRDVPYSAMPSMDGRWKVCPLLCNAISWMVGGRVTPILQCHFWIEGGRCAPYSAIPSLNGRWKVCPPLLCNTASRWKVESVSTILQYREGGRCVNNNNSAIPFWMERRRCFICSAIPFSGWKLEGGMPPYSAVLSLHRSWKGCPLICNMYRLWIEG